MNDMRQTWLVARREMLERSRTRSFRISVVIMIVTIVAVIVLPSVLTDDSGEAHMVAITGTHAPALSTVIVDRGESLGLRVTTKQVDGADAGRDELREGRADALVVDAASVEWLDEVDPELQAVINASVQIVTVQERAAAAGLDPGETQALFAPVPVETVLLDGSAGTEDDEAAAFVMTLVLFFAIATYGALVLTGVVEEKATRVVEVLLARMPARNLLAGKVAGIGLLGLAQVLVTVVAAVVALAFADGVDVPAARGIVLAWAVVWFVLGFAFYAVAYGVLGSLASRAEDAQSVSGPVTVALVLAYFASIAAGGSSDAWWAVALSYFPVTSPLVMPTRIAMDAVSWYEPVVAAIAMVASIVGLTRLGGRIYGFALLRTGAAMKLRDVWHSTRA